MKHCTSTNIFGVEAFQFVWSFISTGPLRHKAIKKMHFKAKCFVQEISAIPSSLKKND